MPISCCGFQGLGAPNFLLPQMALTKDGNDNQLFSFLA